MNKDSQFVPDYKNWLRRATWRLNEATSLLLNVEPKKVGDLIQSDENFKIEFEEALAIVVTAERIELEVIGQTISHANGVTYAKVKPKNYIQWVHSKNYEIPEQLLHLLGDKEEKQVTRELTDNDGSLPQIQTVKTDSRIDQRVQDIARVAKIWFIDQMNIPDGGKTKLRTTLCKLNPDLFISTSTFDKAWQKAVKENLVKMEDSEIYSKGK